ncbi:CheR family methyltransferase [Tautonia plasticadhaerens]|uniref:Putative biofilm formation methyltransferase WspC n=1 Tax=Tautonia plasticadhaerens TaxID=2527974 RepID=A0A518GUT7_9BACT|nr:CheR family methyltransferase [Tautonia plasticadhaerens]QDV32349.1 putative biofilm formation methyltransferase WspC [Tautonia plasticadhaerens]
MGAPESEPDLIAAERVLGERIGLNPDSLGRGPIAQAVTARRKALGLAAGAYAGVLSGREDEPQALIEEVVVPESWFFRDRLPFEHLAMVLAPAWRDDPGRPPLRSLCLPCAGGEEPYSVVIALLDSGLPPGRFRVVAVDVSRRELDRARAATYRSHSFRGVDAAVRDRHFDRVGEAWRVASPARDLVDWQQGNLLDPALADRFGDFDVVFCRNLLIYFHDEARRRASAAFGRLVTPGGTLFVGHAEAGLPLGPAFLATGRPGTFAFLRSRDDPAGDGPPPRPGPPRRVDAPAPRPGARSATGGPRATRPATAPGRRTPPVTASGEAPGATDTVERAAELANQGAWEAATAMAGRLVSRSPSDPSAHVLLGAIAQGAGRSDLAEASFRRAVYLDGHRVDALLALAALAEAKGDRAAAANYRRRADRADRREVGS